MKTSSLKTWVEISSSALSHNFYILKKTLGKQVAMMIVVKSNAYGHGLVEVARIAERESAVSWLGVDNVDEGIRLRHAGIRLPILILGATLLARLQDCVDHGLSFVAYNRETIRALKRLRLSAKNQALIHLKVETGTHRQGIRGEELIEFAQSIQQIPHVVIEGVSTHFANIEDAEHHSFAEQQLRNFQQEILELQRRGIDPVWKHAACSAAALLFPETYFNLARVGIASYGLWPSRETKLAAYKRSKSLQLKPVLTWKTRIVQIKTVDSGQPIGYGLSERVERETRLAVLPVGYWDGYDRGFSNIGQVLVHGKKCKILGRICMNMCMVDVTGVSCLRVEDPVILLGKHAPSTAISAEELSLKIQTIPYEIVTRINPEIPRILVP